jgi:hypothetical protein
MVGGPAGQVRAKKLHAKRGFNSLKSCRAGMVQTLVASSLSICGPQRCKKVEKWQKRGEILTKKGAGGV